MVHLLLPPASWWAVGGGGGGASGGPSPGEVDRWRARMSFCTSCRIRKKIKTCSRSPSKWCPNQVDISRLQLEESSTTIVKSDTAGRVIAVFQQVPAMDYLVEGRLPELLALPHGVLLDAGVGELDDAGAQFAAEGRGQRQNGRRHAVLVQLRAVLQRAIHQPHLPRPHTRSKKNGRQFHVAPALVLRVRFVSLAPRLTLFDLVTLGFT